MILNVVNTIKIESWRMRNIDLRLDSLLAGDSERPNSDICSACCFANSFLLAASADR